jgi:hypothetical protein
MNIFGDACWSEVDAVAQRTSWAQRVMNVDQRLTALIRGSMSPHIIEVARVAMRMVPVAWMMLAKLRK